MFLRRSPCYGSLIQVFSVVTDKELLAGFAAKSIHLEAWDHRKHLRLANLHLRKFPLEEAIDRMRSGIRAQGWMRLIDFMIREHGPGKDSESFFETQPHLTQKSLLPLYCSRDRFVSERAKTNFVEPDFAPLPVARKT